VTQTCCYCRRAYGGRAIGTHERFCPERPEVNAATLRVLTDTARPGYAKTQIDYESAAGGTGAASIKALVQHYGTWPAVCEHFGLQVFSTRGGRGSAALNAPLAEWERNACARRGRLEFAG
jgi:hypothetical protein